MSCHGQHLESYHLPLLRDTPWNGVAQIIPQLNFQQVYDKRHSGVPVASLWIFQDGASFSQLQHMDGKFLRSVSEITGGGLLGNYSPQGNLSMKFDFTFRTMHSLSVIYTCYCLCIARHSIALNGFIAANIFTM